MHSKKPKPKLRGKDKERNKFYDTKQTARQREIKTWVKNQQKIDITGMIKTFNIKI